MVRESQEGLVIVGYVRRIISLQKPDHVVRFALRLFSQSN